MRGDLWRQMGDRIRQIWAAKLGEIGRIWAAEVGTEGQQGEALKAKRQNKGRREVLWKKGDVGYSRKEGRRTEVKQKMGHLVAALLISATEIDGTATLLPRLWTEPRPTDGTTTT